VEWPQCYAAFDKSIDSLAAASATIA